MTARPAVPALQLAGKPRAIEGFLHGLRHPCLEIELTHRERGRPEWLDRAGALLDAELAAYPGEASVAEPDAPQPAPPVIAALLKGLLRLQQAAGFPIGETGRVTAAAEGGTRFVVPVATDPRATSLAVGWLVRLCNLCAAGADTGAHRAGFGGLIEGLGPAPGSANVPRFIRAARRLDFPVHEITSRILQVGSGSRARWLESSFTDRTPRLGARIARNKGTCASVLRQYGLPAPTHFGARDVEEAVQAAERLGYPVVVKPEDRDGGEAVSPGLMTPAEVREAFARARAASPKVLVEKHFFGRDYRMVVFNSELIWTIERVPGGVTGDGKSTVAELVAFHNLDPRRQGPRPALPPLALDEEADTMLARAGLSHASVPADGAFVRLRRAANIVSGGTPVPANDQVHPDNRRLAIRAADILGLDLAGIDLLIPDIGRSWMETGAVICEVNAQPNLGQTTSAHLYGEILEHLVEGNGRIPVVAVIGAAAATQIAETIRAGLETAGLRVGMAGPAGVSVAGNRVSMETRPSQATSILALDRQVDAAIVVLGNDAVLGSGLAFDRIDVLVLAESVLAQGGDAGAVTPATVQAVAAALMPMCDGVVLTLSGRVAELPAQAANVARVEPPAPIEQVAADAVRRLLDANVRHAWHRQAATSAG